MEIKIITMPLNTKESQADIEFLKIGFNCIKFNLDYRTGSLQKVMNVIRGHNFYKNNFSSALAIEGLFSIFWYKKNLKSNRREFFTNCLKRKNILIGSPDFLIWNNDEIYFCEFKSKNDVFKMHQIEWFNKFNIFPCAIAIATKVIRNESTHK